MCTVLVKLMHIKNKFRNKVEMKPKQTKTQTIKVVCLKTLVRNFSGLESWNESLTKKTFQFVCSLTENSVTCLPRQYF